MAGERVVGWVRGGEVRSYDGACMRRAQETMSRSVSARETRPSARETPQPIERETAGPPGALTARKHLCKGGVSPLGKKKNVLLYPPKQIYEQTDPGNISKKIKCFFSFFIGFTLKR